MSSAAPATVVIRPRRGWHVFTVQDIWEYRHLLWTLGMRDVKLRYKQTYLGALWVLIQPLLATGILTAVFGYIAAIPSPSGVPYFAYVYIGQVGFQLFSLTLARTSGAMIGNSVLVTKIYVPRPLLPLSTIPAVLLDFLIGFALAIPIILVYGIHLSNAWMALVAGLALLLLATGVGLAFAALSVWYRDVLF